NRNDTKLVRVETQAVPWSKPRPHRVALPKAPEPSIKPAMQLDDCRLPIVCRAGRDYPVASAGFVLSVCHNSYLALGIKIGAVMDRYVRSTSDCRSQEGRSPTCLSHKVKQELVEWSDSLPTDR